MSEGKALSLDQVKRRSWSLANRCFLYHIEEESIDHILVHCVMAKVLWQLLLALFNVSWVFPSMIRETLLGWHDAFLDKKQKKAWKIASLCIF